MNTSPALSASGPSGTAVTATGASLLGAHVLVSAAAVWGPFGMLSLVLGGACVAGAAYLARNHTRGRGLVGLARRALTRPVSPPSERKAKAFAPRRHSSAQRTRSSPRHVSGAIPQRKRTGIAASVGRSGNIRRIPRLGALRQAGTSHKTAPTASSRRASGRTPAGRRAVRPLALRRIASTVGPVARTTGLGAALWRPGLRPRARVGARRRYPFERAAMALGRTGLRVALRLARRAWTMPLLRQLRSRLATLLRFWRDKKRVLRAPRKTAVPAPAKPAPKPAQALAVQPPTGRPRTPIASRFHTRKVTPMSLHPLMRTVEAIEADTTAFHVRDGAPLRNALRLHEGTAELFDALSAGYRRLEGDLNENFKIDPAAAEYMATVAGHIATLATLAQEACEAFRSVHAPDLERIDDPDPRADTLDVSTNRE